VTSTPLGPMAFSPRFRNRLLTPYITPSSVVRKEPGMAQTTPTRRHGQENGVT